MRYWLYVEPAGASSEPVFVIMSDKAVLAQYWDYWCMRMRTVGREEEINEEDCILDWAVLHWATEATNEALTNIIVAPNEQNSSS